MSAFFLVWCARNANKLYHLSGRASLVIAFTVVIDRSTDPVGLASIDLMHRWNVRGRIRFRPAQPPPASACQPSNCQS